MVFGLFGKKEAVAQAPKPPVRKGPAGLQVDRVVVVDLVEYGMASSPPGMPIPSTFELVVVAHGMTELGSGRFLHRFYDDEHRYVQVMADGEGENATILDVSLFRPWDSLTPADRREWDEWTGKDGKIGAKSYDADGVLFDRAWSPEIDRWIEPVRFTEDVLDRDGRRTSVQQLIMLYDRLLGNELVETLIVSSERQVRPSEDEPTIQFYLGLPLSAVAFKVI